jgi:hypothetical protein
MIFIIYTVRQIRCQLFYVVFFKRIKGEENSSFFDFFCQIDLSLNEKERF